MWCWKPPPRACRWSQPKVGGIRQKSFGPQSGALVPPDDVVALTRAIARRLTVVRRQPPPQNNCAKRVRTSFSIEAMVDGVLDAYGTALESLRQTAAVNGF